MVGRKRRRAQAFQEDEAEEFEPEQAQVDDEKDQAQREQEVWDAVREERFEIVEQLPLTLHRQLSLMKQLDEQAQSYLQTLSPTLRSYFDLRKRLDQNTSNSDAQTSAGNSENTESSEKPPTASSRQESSSASMLLPSERAKQPNSTRELLSHIGWLSEELLRASQEKVNLAQATYDSTERHIRLLDMAIREQEASLSNEGSIQLPDLTIPRSGRETKASSNTLIDSYNAITVKLQDANMADTDEDEELIPLEKALMKEVAMNLIINPKTTEDPEEEPTYCYCNRISFGEMIACDNEACTLEWFHLGCVGLTEPPEGEWFCENCTRFDA